MPHSQLVLRGIKLSVSLGCYDFEKVAPQGVEVDVWIRDLSLPSACVSDRLEETLCYNQLVQELTQITAERHFELLEHLTYTIYHFTKEKTKKPIIIRVRKFPMPDCLSQGVTFALGDWDLGDL